MVKIPNILKMLLNFKENAIMNLYGKRENKANAAACTGYDWG